MSKTKIDFDTVLEKVDPIQAAVMILGGTAAACGIVPPMTKLLQAFNGESSNGTVFGALDVMVTPLLVFDVLNWAKGNLESMLNPNQPVDQETLGQRLKVLGLFCSGAVEAAIMYQLVSNPDTMKTVLALPGQLLQGVGKIIP